MSAGAARVFAAALTFWVVLSGRLGPLEIGVGMAAAAGIAAASRREERLGEVVRALPRLAGYAPWLLGQVVLASVEVARLVLHPALPIAPVVLTLRPGLGGDVAITALANSITLTPGTVTLEVEDGGLVVHALTAEAGRALVEGPMVGRVAAVFGEHRP